MPGLLRIGTCEVDLAAGEVQLDGLRRAVEPRVFALLAYLAQHPDRVLTKQELFESVWGDRTVSDSALARTVMKARQAIGDTGEPPLIRTVPRVGYRLVSPSRNAPPAVATASAGAPIRVALLPLDNRTSDETLDWVRLGLMALVDHALGQEPRLSVVAAEQIIAVVEGAAAAGADLAETVRNATGAHVVLTGHLSRTRDGYQLGLEGVGAGRMKIRAQSVGELGPRAALAIRNALLQEAAGARAPEFSDPLAMTAFARALQALARQKYGEAANLLRMTLTLAPGHAAVELNLLRALCSVADLEGATPIAARLLPLAAQSNDPLLAARVHFALARAHMHRSAFAQADEHIAAGLRELGDEAPADEVAFGYLLRAKVAAYLSDHPKAEQWLDRMRDATDRTGDRLLPIYRLSVLAAMAHARGEYEKSTDFNLEAARSARAVHAQSERVTSEGNASTCFLLLGRWSEAAEHVEQAFAGALLLNDPYLACVSALHGTFVYLVTGVPAAAQRVVQALPPAQEPTSLSHHWAVLARANHAACAGDHEAAVRWFYEARRGLREAGIRMNENEVLVWLLYSLVRCGRIEEAEAELSAVLPSDESRVLDPAQRPLLHCQAHILHARGQASQALDVLLGMLRVETVPLWRAWAAIDAAWLLAEGGDAAQALAQIGQLPPEIAAHASACAVAARAHFCAGDTEGALRHHRRYIDATSTGRANPFLASLGACYAEGRTVPKAPGLPSRL